MRIKFLTAIQSALFPPNCVVCGHLTFRQIAICHACEVELPQLEPGCQKCALPLMSEIGRHAICGKCLKNPPPFDQTLALYHYAPPIRQLLHSLKFNSNLSYSRVLGQLMIPSIEQHYSTCNLPESIIPMPLHPTRLRQRGFNQALEIAKPIAKKLKVPINYSQAHRIRATLAQTLIPAKLRYKNVKNAFQVKPFKATHVAVVDDVMTTGFSASELCIALRRIGITRIDLWCCARTIALQKNIS